jgi:hypothetical protein
LLSKLIASGYTKRAAWGDSRRKDAAG